MHPEVSARDIVRAEQILFGTHGVFDDERKLYIRSFDTLDVLAVPGSGKTTALLAKLIIMAKHQKEKGCGGILVLSHTNAAVDQIIEKIGKYCPSLFVYPNFIGTIQRFVDTFLAIPFFELKFGFRPDNIESELYVNKIEKAYSSFVINPSGFSSNEIKNARYFINSNEGLISEYRFNQSDDGIWFTRGLNGKIIEIKKPRRANQRNYVDFNDSEKQKIWDWLKKFKVLFWKKFRTIHYDDAYFFSNAYVKELPRICGILKERFHHIFVDEMQDMDIHQIALLDKIFLSDEPNRTFHRIGDKNQSIFSYDVKLDDVWQQRARTMTLSKSMRLSDNIAKRVQPFALNPIPLLGANVESNVSAIKPYIILYSESNITQVLEKYVSIIKSLQQSSRIPMAPKHKFKVIGWRKYSSDAQSKTIVKSYCPGFNQERGKSKLQLEYLCDFFACCSWEEFSSTTATEVIANALVKVLALQNIRDTESEFTRIKFEKYLKTSHPSLYEEYNILVYEIIKALVQRNFSVAQTKFKVLAIKVVQQINQGTALSLSALQFIDTANRPSMHHIDTSNEENIFEVDGIKLHVGTVHSVKGETHCATLYLETYYYLDGNKSFESQRLIDQLKGTQIPPSAGSRTKQSARVVYVGFSRPTHLLCVACRRDRILGHETELENAGWIIDDTLNSSQS